MVICRHVKGLCLITKLSRNECFPEIDRELGISHDEQKAEKKKMHRRGRESFNAYLLFFLLAVYV